MLEFDCIAYRRPSLEMPGGTACPVQLTSPVKTSLLYSQGVQDMEEDGAVTSIISCDRDVCCVRALLARQRFLSHRLFIQDVLHVGHSAEACTQAETRLCRRALPPYRLSFKNN